MTRADKVLSVAILLVVLSTCLLYHLINLNGANSTETSATIKSQGVVVEQIILPVKKKRTIVIEGKIGSTVVEVENGQLRILEAPCPKQICSGRGWISYPGESIICVPNEVVIIIEGKESGMDAILQ